MPQVGHAGIAEPFSQIPPGNASSIAVENGRDKPPIVLGSHSDMGGSAGEQIANAIPLIVS